MRQMARKLLSSALLDAVKYRSKRRVFAHLILCLFFYYTPNLILICSYAHVSLQTTSLNVYDVESNLA